MRLVYQTIAAAALVAAGGNAALAQGPGRLINDAIIATLGAGLEYPGGVSRLPNGHVGDTLTMGDVVQGGLYGNAANTDGTNNGHGTLPSLAPGPQACSPPALGGCDVIVDGITMGEIRQEVNPAALGLVPAP